jgi:hypothetical protein
MSVTVRKLTEGGDRYVVFEGAVEGEPQATQRRSVLLSALLNGACAIEQEKAQLVADVEAAAARLKLKRELT